MPYEQPTPVNFPAKLKAQLKIRAAAENKSMEKILEEAWLNFIENRPPPVVDVRLAGLAVTSASKNASFFIESENEHGVASVSDLFSQVEAYFRSKGPDNWELARTLIYLMDSQDSEVLAAVGQCLGQFARIVELDRQRIEANERRASLPRQADPLTRGNELVKELDQEAARLDRVSEKGRRVPAKSKRAKRGGGPA